MNGYYPVMLQLRGERCVIIGGGRIAERKLQGLLEAGADNITLVSPRITPRLQELAASGSLHWQCRIYQPSDAEGARLLFGATDDPKLNRRIAEDGRRAGAWVNTVDEAEGRGFLNPSVVRRGDLLIAVSATGASPALSIRLKRELEQQYGEEYGYSAGQLRRLRDYMKVSGFEPGEREALLRLAAEEVPFKGETEVDITAWIKQLRAKRPLD
ncbi:bifunctional precorrin-2 dehydrogenase/sirohydrochlorin ferrochelatase [Paenibacillus glycanilyticus]|uniref:precorrin-2 dehydrogenase/sirohydrochlorin ferrochelatase family protein n=1 Tax=Paenibacillus glycanilyticus TaxID=126569 RepID=UPI0020404285|nr:bifunctional precorrin-2 dehydrogenase/sirohydrochlorin ferrochelatase [Paenibacillus glycanilyticus]MCM3630072.1 bifunctional precorrin-2 dehydrogenase/sirohydrochlorin ferrochelatase [Paenibacillus glycanilyticus]